MGRCKLLGSLIHSFHEHLSYLGPILFPCSPCFFIPPAPQQSPGGGGGWGGGCIHWIAVLGALIRIWRPEIADGCDISCLLICQQILSFQFMIHSVLKYFGAQVVPDWVSRNPFRMALNVLVTCPHYIFEHFPAFWCPRMSQACLLAPAHGHHFE